MRASSFRRLRGLTCAAIIADEAAYWLADDGSANPDTEILTACRPMLATTGGPLIVITSPYGRRGSLWETYQRHFGPDGDPRILVAQGESRALNPELSEEFVARQYERDPAAASAEYGAQFRVDVQGFLTVETVRRCTDLVGELPPERKWNYVAFTDVSGGSADSFTLAIAHMEGRNAVIDCVRERVPPFPPEQVTEEYCTLMRKYGIWTVTGDRYGGEWPREQFRRHGITYEPCERTKSDLYIDLLAGMNSETVGLDGTRASATPVDFPGTPHGARGPRHHRPPEGRKGRHRQCCCWCRVARTGAGRGGAAQSTPSARHRQRR